jgi:hypothetical protein
MSVTVPCGTMFAGTDGESCAAASATNTTKRETGAHSVRDEKAESDMGFSLETEVYCQVGWDAKTKRCLVEL